MILSNEKTMFAKVISELKSISKLTIFQNQAPCVGYTLYHCCVFDTVNLTYHYMYIFVQFEETLLTYTLHNGQ